MNEIKTLSESDRDRLSHISDKAEDFIRDAFPARGDWWVRKASMELCGKITSAIDEVGSDFDPIQHDPIHCFESTIDWDDHHEGLGWVVHRRSIVSSKASLIAVTTLLDLLDVAAERSFEIIYEYEELQIWQNGRLIGFAFENHPDLVEA